MARHHRFAKRKRLSLADVAEERWAIARTHTSPWQLLHQVFEEHDLSPPKVTMVSNSVLLRHRTVAVSDLLNFASRRFLQELAPPGAFVVLPVKELRWAITVCVIYRQGAYLPPAGRRFIELLQTSARRQKAPVALSAPAVPARLARSEGLKSAQKQNLFFAKAVASSGNVRA